MDGRVLSDRRRVRIWYQANASNAPRTTAAPIAPPTIAPTFTEVVAVVAEGVDILFVVAAPTVAEDTAVPLPGLSVGVVVPAVFRVATEI